MSLSSLNSDYFYYEIKQLNQTATLKPTPSNPSCDAQTLKKALKDDCINEETIINVLTNRISRQRLQIAAEYKKLCGNDLICELEDRLSGDFKNLMVALVKPPAEFLADELHYAISGLGTDEKTLVEILCTATNLQIDYIKHAYEKKYEKPLVEDIAGDTSGIFQRWLISLLSAERSECENVNEEAIKKDIDELKAACSGSKSDPEESVFLSILGIVVNRHPDHLHRVFQHLQQYRENSQNALDEIIEKFTGDAKNSMLAIVKSMEDKSTFFAERLHDAMAGIGTSDRQLIRIVVSRCEVDMFNIKQAYEKLYERCLEEDIIDDTSGHYKDALLSLIKV
ncbi:annexin-B12-like [Planococcus citri]|uniref:annexin-B12-like n=1 Tax=Planococcus citri TaxID=170843 RepID=UPI0031F73B95